MAATSTSADTPLLIAGAVYADGLSGNWFWWASAPGVLATLFFFARLWRRAGVVTEVEVLALRYGPGIATQRYRMLNALFEGVIVNALVLASNVFAFTLVLTALLGRWGLGDRPGLAGILVLACLLASGVYTLIVGFRGLAKSGAVEFAISIGVAILLACLAVGALPHGLSSLPPLAGAHSGDALFAIWPGHDVIAPLVLLACSWWHTAPGRGMLVQRIAASHDERSAMLTVLTFAGLHYLARPWAWYVIGGAGLLALPHLANAEAVFPAMAARLLPSGLFGLLVMAMALSFMASVNSRLNFGASLIVNDIATVLRPALPSRDLKRIETAVIALLCLIALVAGSASASLGIRALYQFLTTMLAGTGFVAIARWYWSRTTIWCEISSLASAILVAALSLALVNTAKPLDYALALGVNFAVGALVTVMVAHFGPAADLRAAVAFHDRVRPAGPGWSDHGSEPAASLAPLAIQWLAANGALLAGVFAIARSLACDGAQAAGFSALCTACLGALWLARRQGRMGARSTPVPRTFEQAGHRQ